MAACLVKSYSVNQGATFRSRKATAVRVLDFYSEDRNVSNRVALSVREPNDQSASHMVGQKLQRQLQCLISSQKSKIAMSLKVLHFQFEGCTVGQKVESSVREQKVDWITACWSRAATTVRVPRFQS